MNSSNLIKLRQKTSKSTKNSRSAIPHNDPPDFKKYNFKRYIPMNENLLWFKDMYSQEYHVTLKHNHLRGAKGALFTLFLNTFGGLFLPLGIYICLKRYGHKHAQYFNAKSVIMPGHPAYENSANFPRTIENRISSEGVHEYIIKGHPDFYYMDYPRTVDVNKSTPIEEYYKNYMVKNTKAGASA